MFQPLCAAPLRYPDPVPNSTLLQMFLIIRHGARLPFLDFNTTVWSGPPIKCSNKYILQKDRKIFINGKYLKPPSEINETCDIGQITLLGLEQEEELGSFYNSILVNKTGLLTPEYDPKEVFVRSTFVNRTQDSAIAFFHGLYNPSKPTHVRAVVRSSDSDTKEVAPNELNITYLPPDIDSLFPDPRSCYEIGQIAVKYFIGNETTDKRRAEAEKMFEKFNYSSDIFNWMFLGDHYYALSCHDQKPKPEYELTNEQLELSVRNIGVYLNEFGRASAKESSAGILRMILDRINKYFSLESTAKFSLFSAHDTTVADFLGYLGYYLVYPPPYRSHIAVEVLRLDRPYIRFIYNGEVIPFRGSEITPLSEFKAMVKKDLDFCKSYK